MMGDMKHPRFMCEDDDFKVEGEDKKEVMEHGRMHLKETHGMDATDEDLEADMKMV